MDIVLFLIATLVVTGHICYFLKQQIKHEIRVEQRLEQLEQEKILIAEEWVNNQVWKDEEEKEYAMILFKTLKKSTDDMNHIYNNYKKWTNKNYEYEEDTLKQYWEKGRHTIYNK